MGIYSQITVELVTESSEISVILGNGGDRKIMANKLILQNIVNEILKECEIMEIEDVNEEFCTYYVKLLALDPKWGLSGLIMNIRSDVHHFVKFVVGRLKNVDQPSMKALKVQCHFESNINLLEDSIKLHEAEVEKLLYPLKVALLEPDNKNDIDDSFELWVAYSTLASGIGDPSEPTVYKEVEAVLKSIWTKDEVIEFWNDKYTVRVEKLSHMVKLVAGIRLYNKECGRRASGVLDLPELLLNAIDAVINKIQKIHDGITRGCLEVLTAVVESCYSPTNTKNRMTLAENIPDYADRNDLEYCKDLILLYKTYQEKLSKLVAEANGIKKARYEILMGYNGIISDLRDKIVPNIYISASSVFPIFEQLFDKWIELKDKTVVLTRLKILFDELFSMMSSVKLENVLVKNFKSRSVSTCLNRLFRHKFGRSIREGVVVLKKEYDIFKAETQPKYQYQGHCCWILVNTNGFFVKGDDDHGIVSYKSKFYIFDSQNGLRDFIMDPEYYIHRVLDLARKKCELIPYLRLETQLIALQNIVRITEEERTYVELYSIGIHAHFQPEENIGAGYESNIWKYKKRALKLADLINCKTSSTQTEHSHNIISENTQTWLLKENSTQTKSHGYSNAPVSVDFLYGIRGRKDDHQVKINFSCDGQDLPVCHSD